MGLTLTSIADRSRMSSFPSFSDLMYRAKMQIDSNAKCLGDMNAFLCDLCFMFSSLFQASALGGPVYYHFNPKETCVIRALS